MVVVFGEILLDRFPDYQRIGGAPFNVAFHLWNLGVPIRFLSGIGDDADGRRILSFLNTRGFPTSDLQIDNDKATGRVEVNFGPAGDQPEYDIVPDTAYDAVSPAPSVEKALEDRAKLLYFGTLIQRSAVGRSTLAALLSSRGPDVRCLVDLNLRTGCYSAETVEYSLRAADILKLNESEFEEILALCQPGGSVQTISDLMACYGIQMVALTRGEKGSCIYTDEDALEARPNAAEPFRDSVGAGDGFAAILALGCLRDWPPNQILRAASAFASRICTIEGAVPETRQFYQDFSKGVLHAG